VEILTGDVELLLDDLVNPGSIFLLVFTKLFGNIPDNIRCRKFVDSDLRNVSYLIDVWGPVQKLLFQ
jgi:hypothetical protein